MKHKFVEYIPENLDEGVVYVSIPYATAAHRCACGCGNEVVTPISPVDWELRFDGQSVSLSPSIGNWSFKCRSHYWIVRDEVRWSAKWSDDKIAAARARDQFDKTRFFDGTSRYSAGGKRSGTKSLSDDLQPPSASRKTPRRRL